MFEQIKRLFNHSVVYGLGEMGGRIVSLLLLPVVLRYLSPEDYGILEIFQVIKNLCIAFLPLGLASAVFRYYLKTQNPEEQTRVVSNAFLVLLTISTITFLVGLLKRSSISTLLWGSPEFSLHVLVVFGTITLEILKCIPFALLRAKEKSTFFAVVNVTQIILGLCLNILFLVVFKLGILAILLGNLLATIFVFLFLTPTIRKYIRLRFDIREIRRLLRFGAPVAVSSITFLLINSMDRFFIKYYCTPDELGMYALGFRFVSLLTIFLINPFNLAWLPFALSIEKNENAKDIYANVLIYFLLVGLVLALVIILFAPEVIRLMAPPSYWGSYRFLVFLVLAYLVFGLYQNVRIGISITEKTHYYLFGSFGALGVNFILNSLLVPRFHLLGAAWSNLGAYLTLFFVVFFLSMKTYFIRYDYRRIFLQSSVFFVILLLSLFVSGEPLVFRIAAKTFLLFLFPLSLYFFGFYTRAEVHRIKSLFGNQDVQ